MLIFAATSGKFDDWSGTVKNLALRFKHKMIVSCNLTKRD